MNGMRETQTKETTMETSTESTRVRTGFAMPHPLAVIEQSRRDGREIIGYRVFGYSEVGYDWTTENMDEFGEIPSCGTTWRQIASCVSSRNLLNRLERNGCLLSPVYSDEVK